MNVTEERTVKQTLIFDKDNLMRKERLFNNGARKFGNVFIGKKIQIEVLYTSLNEQKLDHRPKSKMQNFKISRKKYMRKSF